MQAEFHGGSYEPKEMKKVSLWLVLGAMGLALLGGIERGEGEESVAGSPEHTNRLVHESSPYLRLHAHNPVDWYPWGPEALERARDEQKPIFLSVGYSTCYWCHVMEREVFEDPELAALMNEWFVNIKVDREERPELDEIYMTATQLLTRQGGWPNSVFLTPELEPFFAGTYFPPEDKDGRPGFRRIIEALNRLWRTERPRVEAEAQKIAEALRQTLAEKDTSSAPTPDVAMAERAVTQLAAAFDPAHGGFGAAPKFPSPASLYLLWERAEQGDSEARRMVVETLSKMGRGAIYDHLDGGFHRYTLDALWRVPHFEKMLYDNAHLGELLARVAVATGDAELERLARGTFDFVLEWMRVPNGAFKSAIDAETDAVEGAYYIWTREEFEEALDDEGMKLLGPLFGLDGEPNFEEHHYTLYLDKPLDESARELELARTELLAAMEPHLEDLRRFRGEREFPLVDDKVLTDWNGMMIAALARGGQLLKEPVYVEAAGRAAEFLLTLKGEDGVQLHAWREGKAKIPAFLDDYAFLVRALLALHDVTGADSWLTEAKRLSEQMEERLRAGSGGYYMSAARPDLLFQVVSAVDGSIPSGNGVAILNLLELAELTGRPAYRERAQAALKSFGADLEQHPRAVATVALATLRGGAFPLAEGGGEVASAPPPPMSALAREVVEIAGRFEGEGGADGYRPFRVELEIRDGWHVNANPASLEFLIPTSVEGVVREVRYPEGESFSFEFAPEEISVYGGETVLRGEVAEAEAALEVTYQACDDRRCLPPVTREVRLE
jgi:uncharacterized protein YyaL (SSP411 family)